MSITSIYATPRSVGPARTLPSEDLDKSAPVTPRQAENEGFRDLLRAANAGKADAQYAVGAHCEMGTGGFQEDAKEAATWYARATSSGHPQATFALGSCYAHGRGVASDINKAITCWLHAAELGHAGAQCCVGVAYSLGWGVAADAARAAAWFARAAASGHAEALYNLGVCYRKGRGVSMNAALADAYFRRAAAAGHACADGY